MVTITVVITVILSMHILQLAATEVLGETRAAVIEDGSGSAELDYEDEVADQLYAVMTKWSVVIIDGGVLLWAFAREYKRSRTTAARAPP